MSIEQWQANSEVALSSSQDVAVHRLGEWAHSANAAHQIAQTLVQTSFVPDSFKNKPGEATAAILAGLEVGLQPMAALRSFDVIQGQAAPRAITLRAIVQSHGHEMILEESTATRCKMRGRRKGTAEWLTVVWTTDRARALGLMNKPNWKNQPQTMLVARATSELGRLIAADAILGLPYSAEEVADGTTVDTQTGEVTSAAPTGSRRMSRKRPTPEPEPQPAPDEAPAEPMLDTGSDLAKAMFASFNDAGITDRDERLAYVSRVVGREIASSAEMTDVDARAVLDALSAPPSDPDVPDPTDADDPWSDQ